jgi:cupin 2 domain-containing protein
VESHQNEKIRALLDLSEIEDFSQEITDILYEDTHTRIERIISCGQVSPSGFWYDQTEDEWICLLQGEAVLRLEDECIRLRVGDSMLIPAHQKHRVEFTGSQPKTIWLCVFTKKEDSNGTKENRSD